MNRIGIWGIPFTLLITTSLSGQVSIPVPALEQHVHILASDTMLGRGFGTVQGLKAAHYIENHFRESGIAPLKGSYVHPFNYRSGILNIAGANVAGVIEGSDPDLKDEYIVVGAHFDHVGWEVKGEDTVIFNGADDNASGTASIIEIGKYLSGHRENLGRSVIIVAFDGEESGLIGSTHFLEQSIVPLSSIKAMFSLDMVGMLEAHKGLDLKGVDLLNDKETITGEVAGRYGISITKEGSRIEQRTDTEPFGKKGIPAVHAFTGTESPYHKPEDTADLLDYDGMSRVAGFMCDVTMQLSNSVSISSMTPPEEGEKTASKGFLRTGIRASIGSASQDYREEFYQGKSIFAAQAGVFASIRLTGFLYLQPEVLYETDGSRHPDGTFRSHAITTPLTLQLSSPQNSMVRSYFKAGGFYSYHFGGTIGNERIDYEQIYNNREYGYTYGFGMAVMNIQMEVNIRNGLSSLLRDTDASPVTQNMVCFTLGVIF